MKIRLKKKKKKFLYYISKYKGIIKTVIYLIKVFSIKDFKQLNIKDFKQLNIKDFKQLNIKDFKQLNLIVLCLIY